MATTVEHTPGPWKVGDLDHNDQRIVRAGHSEICTCWHHCVKSLEEQMEANAKLIAAAPELLHNLKFLVAWTRRTGGIARTIGATGEMLREAEAAISKAEAAQ